MFEDLDSGKSCAGYCGSVRKGQAEQISQSGQERDREQSSSQHLVCAQRQNNKGSTVATRFTPSQKTVGISPFQASRLYCGADCIVDIAAKMKFSADRTGALFQRFCKQSFLEVECLLVSIRGVCSSPLKHSTKCSPQEGDARQQLRRRHRFCVPTELAPAVIQVHGRNVHGALTT